MGCEQCGINDRCRLEVALKCEWKDCDHEWDMEITSMLSNEYVSATKCKKCGVPGEEDTRTGVVYWPAT